MNKTKRILMAERIERAVNDKLANKGDNMTILKIIYGIGQGYIDQRPNIKEMREVVLGTGWTAEYRYSFWVRWWRWVNYYDCEYVLNRNYDDMRNYTA